MRIVSLSILVFLNACTGAYGQKATNTQPKPVAATVCAVLEGPYFYNNHIVKIRGYLEVSSEYSVLMDQNCSDHGIWFAFADGSGLPGLIATVKGQEGRSRNSDKRTITPIPVHLVRDSNLQKLQHYLELSAKGKSCADSPPESFPPSGTVYRITATFVGRIDGVSKKMHTARSSAANRVDGKGFGHMGMYDTELVVQSVEEVVAVEKPEIQPQPKL